MTYKTLFFDADNTLFDFDLSEKRAFEKLFENLDYPGDREVFFRVYQECNASLWRALENKTIEKSIIKTERFRLVLNHFGLLQDPSVIGEQYLEYLGQEGPLIEGAFDLIRDLSEFYKLVIVTNGIEKVQNARMSDSPIRPFFEAVIISEAVGKAKPDPAFFDYALARSAVENRSEALIIGDSLSSDILGGMNSNLDTCWYNPHGEPLTPPYTPTYEVKSFSELRALLLPFSG